MAMETAANATRSQLSLKAIRFVKFPSPATFDNSSIFYHPLVEGRYFVEKKSCSLKLGDPDGQSRYPSRPLLAVARTGQQAAVCALAFGLKELLPLPDPVSVLRP
jgi:hypothetical protein